MTGRSRSAAEALSKCREAVRHVEDDVTEAEREAALWSLYTAFSRLDTYLTGGAALPEPWKIAARLDEHRPTAPDRTTSAKGESDEEAS